MTSTLRGMTVDSASWVERAKSFITGDRDLKTMLSDTSFSMPLASTTPALNARDGQSRWLLPNSTLWGSGEFRSLASNTTASEYDGDIFGFHLGVDSVLPIANGKMLGGVALSWNDGDFNFSTDTGQVDRETGSYNLTMLSLSPYLGYSFGDVDGLNLDAVQGYVTAGFGSGDIEVATTGGETHTSDISTQSLAAGGSGRIWQDNEVSLRAKGQASITSLELDGDDQGNVAADTFNTHQLRLGLELISQSELPDGARLKPTVGIGLRYDGGDGDTGSGVAFSSGMQHSNPRGRVIEGNVYALLGRSNYEEIGISGLFRLPAGKDGQGLSLQFAPGIGKTVSRVDTLLQAQTWNAIRDSVSASTNANSDSDSADKYTPHLKAELGVGVSSRNGHGMFTPYSALNLSSINDRYQLGIRWQPTNSFHLDLSGERSVPDSADAYNEYLLRGELRF